MDYERVIKQLQQTDAVTAAIQDRHARMIVYHEEWLVSQTQAIARHDRWLAEHEAWARQMEQRHEEWRVAHEARMQRLEELMEAFLC
ncbi:MAG TPA: hypothetical protein VML19_25350 [Verrucomicrobiae bacterium]|nr:hypothetical protein [Verrucomicrobiae bacterium]